MNTTSGLLASSPTQQSPLPALPVGDSAVPPDRPAAGVQLHTNHAFLTAQHLYKAAPAPQLAASPDVRCGRQPSAGRADGVGAAPLTAHAGGSRAAVLALVPGAARGPLGGARLRDCRGSTATGLEPPLAADRQLTSPTTPRAPAPRAGVLGRNYLHVCMHTCIHTYSHS